MQDPVVEAVLDTIGQRESGGNYYADATKTIGEPSWGKYQFLPATWASVSKDYLASIGEKQKPLPMTPENQDAVARFQVTRLLDQGLTPTQVYMVWASGRPNPTKMQGVNKYGNYYDLDQYAADFGRRFNKNMLKRAGEYHANLKMQSQQTQEPTQPQQQDAPDAMSLAQAVPINPQDIEPTSNKQEQREPDWAKVVADYKAGTMDPALSQVLEQSVKSGELTFPGSDTLFQQEQPEFGTNSILRKPIPSKRVFTPEEIQNIETPSLVQAPDAPMVASQPIESTIQQDDPAMRSVTEMARPVVEGIGMTAGGAIGAASPMVGGGVVGAGIGGAIAKQVMDKIEKWLKVHPEETGKPPEQVAQKIKEALLLDIPLYTIAEMTGKILDKPVAAISRGFKNRLLPGGAEAIGFAKEQGIPLPPTDVVDSKTLGVFRASLDRFLSSMGIMTKEEETQLRGLMRLRDQFIDRAAPKQAIDNINNRLRNKAIDVVKQLEDTKNSELAQYRDALAQELGLNAPFAREPGGISVQKGIEKWSQGGRAAVSEKYKAAEAAAPKPNQFFEARNSQQKALELLYEQINTSPELRDKQIASFAKSYSGLTRDEIYEAVQVSLNAQDPKQAFVDHAMSLNAPRRSYAKLESDRKALNKLIQKEDAALQTNTRQAGGMSTSTGGGLKHLKSGLTADQEAIAEQVGGDFLDLYKDARNASSKLKTMMENPNIIRVITSNPDRVVDAIVQPKKAHVYTLLEKMLGKERMKPVRDALTDKILNASGEFSAAKTKTVLQQYGDEALSKVYSPSELASLKSISEETIDLFKIKDKNIRNRLILRVAQSDPNKQGAIKTVLFPGGKNNAKNLMMIRDTLSDAEWTEFRRTALENEVLPIHFQGDTGRMEISPVKSAKAAMKYDDDTVRILAGSEENFEFLRNMQNLFTRAKRAERVGGNPSQTARMTITASTVMGVPYLVFNALSGQPDWAKTTGAIASVALPYALAKGMTSAPVRRWLTQGMRTPIESRKSYKVLRNAMTALGVDEAREEIKQQSETSESPQIPETSQPNIKVTSYPTRAETELKPSVVSTQQPNQVTENVPKNIEQPYVSPETMKLREERKKSEEQSKQFDEKMISAVVDWENKNNQDAPELLISQFNSKQLELYYKKSREARWKREGLTDKQIEERENQAQKKLQETEGWWKKE